MNGSAATFLRRFARWNYEKQKASGTLKKIPVPGSPLEKRAIRLGYKRLKGFWAEMNHMQRGVFRHRAEGLMQRGNG